ncbi:hypothetical protein [Streptomyces sp. KR55]|uniref:hypothetical protein n=1 Tax=Streptomyces sp. KR55 TaxID=3457425 RepID=UPI003FD13551
MSHDGAELTVRLDNGEAVGAERLLVATGHRIELAGLGLETVGLDPAAAAVATDGRMRASDGLWAVGDITGCCTGWRSPSTRRCPSYGYGT